MTNSLRDLLPEPLASHCWVAGHQGKHLHLISDGGAWATRLRYQQHEIFKRLNTEFDLELKALRIKIVSPNDRSALPRRRSSELSENAAQTLKRAAQGIDDPGLKAALLRLARHTRRTP